MTPELFAEYREGEEPYDEWGDDYVPFEGSFAPIAKVRSPAVLPPLPPGPAFIHAPELAYRTTDPDYFRHRYNVPEGYTWQPGTESTGAGWVRPAGCAGENYGAVCGHCTECRP